MSNTAKLKILLIGDPGIGKTKIIGSMVTDERLGVILYIDSEDNSASIQSKLEPCTLADIKNDKWVPVKGKLNHIKVKDYPAFSILIGELIKLQNKGETLFDTIVVDSIGSLSIREYDREVDAHKKKKGDDWAKDSYPIFRDFGITIRQSMHQLVDLGVNIVLTCHSSEKKQDSGLTVVSPNIYGQMDIYIPGLCNFVGLIQSTRDPETREMCIQPTTTVKCVKATFEDSQLGATITWKKNDPIISTILDKLGFDRVSSKKDEKEKEKVK